MTYIVEILVIVFAIISILIGVKKKRKLWLGIGIGVLIATVVLGMPGFIEGFQKGFNANA